MYKGDIFMNYGKIYIVILTDASIPNSVIGSWKGANTVPYVKYNIKETDFRIKTATFTSPVYYDLTEGQYAILISSKYHENFAGVILDVDYDEEKGLYNYQCQDWSRRYMTKSEFIFNNCKAWNILKCLMTRGGVSASKPTKKQLKKFKPILSGLRAKGKYDQSIYDGNIYKGNPFDRSMSVVIRDKTLIDAIRSIVHNSLGYFDIYFNDRGVLQIVPMSKTDWENTGLVLNTGEYYDRKFKFSTTNAITTVNVSGSELNVGKDISLTDITGLNLSAFFGTVGTSVANPLNNVSNATTGKKSNSKSKKTTKKTSSKSNKYNNPFNNKPRKVWINADGGSNSMKNALAKELKKKGWTVHVGRTYSNAHYEDYWNVTKKYSVYVTIYNGVCAGTLREAYSKKIQNVLKKKGVQLCVVFDTPGWNKKRGLLKCKYGDFKGISIKRAWDDNFSHGNVAIKDMHKFLKSNKAVYCASPTASGIAKQFLAGGYFKMKGIKV
jgi:hypothetical protein